jgi:hypothetical protein
MEDNSATKGHLSTKNNIVLLLLALVADISTLIPLVGDFVGPIFWISVTIYFWKKGMGIINWRRFAPAIASFITELIPVIQSLPSIIVGMFIVIGLTKLEEKTGISVTSIVSKKAVVKRPIPRVPLNINGYRPPRTTKDATE